MGDIGKTFPTFGSHLADFLESELNSDGSLKRPGYFKLGEYVADAAGIPNYTAKTVIPADVNHVMILWRGATDWNPSSTDPVSMFVNGDFNAGAQNYASTEIEVYNSGGTITTFEDTNQSNNLRVGYTSGVNGVGVAGAGVIFIPHLGNDSDPFGIKYFVALGVQSFDATAHASVPSQSKSWFLTGGIWTPNRISDVTLYADNGTKFVEGSRIDVYGMV